MIKVITILLVQLLVYLICVHFFELYIVAIIFSVISFIYILKKRQKSDNNRLMELAIVETFFTILLYILYYIGHSPVVSYIILFLILIPQGALFILASYKGGRLTKSFNTAIHLLVLIYFSIQTSLADISYQSYSIIFAKEYNYYYEILYLIWGLPFLISGQKYYTIGFIAIQFFSIFLASLHEDFLSMRLFTAQISFIMIFLLNFNVHLESSRYLKKINSTLSVLSSIGIFILIAFYFYQN